MKRLIVICVCVAVLGCGSKPPLKPVPVKGKVVDVAGKGLANLILRFNPISEENKNGRSPTLVSQKDGSFEGECLPGRYEVRAARLPSSPGAADVPGGVAGAPKGTGGGPSFLGAWEIEVPAGGKLDFAFKIE